MSEIEIDESTHKELPSVTERLKHVVMAIFMGIIFAQVILFAVRFILQVVQYPDPMGRNKL